ncbi:MAG TPA: hypothetical protein VKA02_09070 [Candidatus Acidoferrum sp.]|nr:hypothetical protein [Candidatus Acidoferrum sp.]
MLRPALEHFHRIVAQSALQRQMEQEMTRLAVLFEPFEKAALKRRRKAAIQSLGQALFVHWKLEAAVANHV